MALIGNVVPMAFIFLIIFLAGMDMYELNDVLKNVTSIFFFKTSVSHIKYKFICRV